MYRSYAIIPAAGRSVRMGTQKLLMPLGRSTIIENVLGAWLASSVTRVVVVVRPGDDRLQAVCAGCGAELVVPETAPSEMKVSVRLALEHVRQRYRPDIRDAWLLAPADLPRLSAAVIDQLLRCHNPIDPQIVVPARGGKRGHPVLFPWALASAVNRLGEDEGVNALLAQSVVRMMACEDPGILDDVDTPDDYRKLR